MTKATNKGIEALKALTKSDDKKLLTDSHRPEDLGTSGGINGKFTSKLAESLNKPAKSKGPGGARPGAGRPTLETTIIKRGIKDYVDQHINEFVPIQVTDPTTGKTAIVDKPRVTRILETAYALAVGQTDRGNIVALKEWLDRALGKAPQVISSGPTPFRMDIKVVHLIANKVYGESGNSEGR